MEKNGKEERYDTLFGVWKDWAGLGWVGLSWVGLIKGKCLIVWFM